MVLIEEGGRSTPWLNRLHWCSWRMMVGGWYDQCGCVFILTQPAVLSEWYCKCGACLRINGKIMVSAFPNSISNQVGN